MKKPRKNQSSRPTKKELDKLYSQPVDKSVIPMYWPIISLAKMHSNKPRLWDLLKNQTQP